MEPFAKILLVGTGGFLGANARYWLGGFIQSRLGSAFPWETMLINITGCIVIGLFLGIFSNPINDENSRLFFAVGVLGGYTTFSTFGYQAIILISERQYAKALFYIEGSALLSVAGAWLGLVIARAMLGKG